MPPEQSARAILAAKLKLYRQKAGLTIYEVGDKIGKSGKTVSAWEAGHGQPDAEMFVKLYYLYDVPNISEFFGVNDRVVPPDETELLEAYRKLNDSGKTTLLNTAKALAKSGDFKPEEQTE